MKKKVVVVNGIVYFVRKANKHTYQLVDKDGNHFSFVGVEQLRNM